MEPQTLIAIYFGIGIFVSSIITTWMLTQGLDLNDDQTLWNWIRIMIATTFIWVFVVALFIIWLPGYAIQRLRNK